MLLGGADRYSLCELLALACITPFAALSVLRLFCASRAAVLAHLTPFAVLPCAVSVCCVSCRAMQTMTLGLWWRCHPVMTSAPSPLLLQRTWRRVMRMQSTQVSVRVVAAAAAAWFLAAPAKFAKLMGTCAQLCALLCQLGRKGCTCQQLCSGRSEMTGALWAMHCRPCHQFFLCRCCAATASLAHLQMRQTSGGRCCPKAAAQLPQMTCSSITTSKLTGLPMQTSSGASSSGAPCSPLTSRCTLVRIPLDTSDTSAEMGWQQICLHALQPAASPWHVAVPEACLKLLRWRSRYQLTAPVDYSHSYSDFSAHMHV